MKQITVITLASRFINMVIGMCLLGYSTAIAQQPTEARSVQPPGRPVAERGKAPAPHTPGKAPVGSLAAQDLLASLNRQTAELRQLNHEIAASSGTMSASKRHSIETRQLQLRNSLADMSFKLHRYRIDDIRGAGFLDQQHRRLDLLSMQASEARVTAQREVETARLAAALDRIEGQKARSAAERLRSELQAAPADATPDNRATVIERIGKTREDAATLAAASTMNSEELHKMRSVLNAEIANLDSRRLSYTAGAATLTDINKAIKSVQHAQQELIVCQIETTATRESTSLQRGVDADRILAKLDKIKADLSSLRSKFTSGAISSGEILNANSQVDRSTGDLLDLREQLDKFKAVK